MKMNRLTQTLLALGALAVPAQAATLAVGTEIGIDFGPTAPTNNFNGTATTAFGGAPGTDGSITAGTLIDTSGTTIDVVGFTWENAAWSNTDSADLTDLPGQNSAFNDSNLTDWIGRNNTDVFALTFTGLNDAFTYDLIIGHGFVNTTTFTDTTYTVDGQSLTNTHDSGSGAYVSFTGLSTDGSGNLVITLDGNGGPSNNTPDLAVVSALQLTAVPEPSAALLGAFGVLALLRRRRS
ncbi:PEP-CTERM sorting domain-containing protein [Haloferula sp. A504]|uniref:PEP-CTERM sorting domain-containing protein n=1 Tax=Haloferula sp. A504 TaxID=3373601 RepID=UPI0031C0D0E8|nr:PEP-CTERM sorting domain-containing protein [Verrucomicrobiaceae bacterium E54]